MKKALFAVLFGLTTSFVSAETAKPAVAKKAPAPASYKIDPAATKINWLGKKVTGQHNGTVGVKEGALVVTNGKLTGGNVVIDMTSIAVSDLTDAELNSKLTGHLKSSDFFDVEKFKSAMFVVSKVTPIASAKPGEPNANVEGSLTIKGMSDPLSFPALITVTDKSVTAVAKEVKVDRTKYNIRYGSGKFFQGLGDKVIYDDFFIDFNLVANK